jgi:hypothetical protein
MRSRLPDSIFTSRLPGWLITHSADPPASHAIGWTAPTSKLG